MTTESRTAPLRKGVAVAAALAALVVPAVASAQSGYGQYPYPANSGYGQSGYGDQGSYDPCVREYRQRQTTGGLIGTVVGAIAGSQIAAGGVRTEGSLLGGLLGAVVGAGVGGRQAACRTNTNGSYGYSYGQPGYGQSQYGYGQRDYGYAQNGYNTGQDRYGYDPRQSGYPADRAQYENTDGCRLSESRVRLPDGQDDVRYVRTCPDASGRYRVVD